MTTWSRYLALFVAALSMLCASSCSTTPTVWQSPTGPLWILNSDSPLSVSALSPGGCPATACGGYTTQCNALCRAGTEWLFEAYITNPQDLSTGVPTTRPSVKKIFDSRGKCRDCPKEVPLDPGERLPAVLDGVYRTLLQKSWFLDHDDRGPMWEFIFDVAQGDVVPAGRYRAVTDTELKGYAVIELVRIASAQTWTPLPPGALGVKPTAKS